MESGSSMSDELEKIRADCRKHDFASTIHDYCPFCRLNEEAKERAALQAERDALRDALEGDHPTMKKNEDSWVWLAEQVEGYSTNKADYMALAGQELRRIGKALAKVEQECE